MSIIRLEYKEVRILVWKDKEAVDYQYLVEGVEVMERRPRVTWLML